jgi:transcriptional regulator with XRE-family HTH domain
MSEVARIYPLKRQQSQRRSPEPQPPKPQAPEPLWREVLGQRLRTLRAERGETLAETAERAGISPQYLSEVERGRKEPSSEMIAALAGALGTTLIQLTEQVAGDLRRRQAISLARASAPRASRSRASGPVMLSLAA